MKDVGLSAISPSRGERILTVVATGTAIAGVGLYLFLRPEWLFAAGVIFLILLSFVLVVVRFEAYRRMARSIERRKQELATHYRRGPPA